MRENKKCIKTFQATQTLQSVFSSSTQQSAQTVALSLCYRPQLCTSTNSQNWTRKEMSNGVDDNTECSTWPPHHDVNAAGNHYSRNNRTVFHLLLFPKRLSTYSSNYSLLICQTQPQVPISFRCPLSQITPLLQHFTHIFNTKMDEVIIVSLSLAAAKPTVGRPTLRSCGT